MFDYQGQVLIEVWGHESDDAMKIFRKLFLQMWTVSANIGMSKQKDH